MFNYGTKRGYNNSSGWMYTEQGKTNMEEMPNDHEGHMKGMAYLPLFFNSKPQYKNEENTKAFLLYSRNGMKQKMKGTKRLKLSKDTTQEGGTETMADFQTI
tara:strand:+ start:1005 stop:1310 length:306 start_codon:yes stop_codon:yes gene_type:complete